MYNKANESDAEEVMLVKDIKKAIEKARCKRDHCGDLVDLTYLNKILFK